MNQTIPGMEIVMVILMVVGTKIVQTAMGPEVNIYILCSTSLSTKFVLLLGFKNACTKILSGSAMVGYSDY